MRQTATHHVSFANHLLQVGVHHVQKDDHHLSTEWGIRRISRHHLPKEYLQTLCDGHPVAVDNRQVAGSGRHAEKIAGKWGLTIVMIPVIFISL